MTTILIVEDNPADVFLIKEVLAGAGLTDRYSLQFAEDGEEALQALSRHSNGGPPGLVLLDLNLPKSGGMEVLQRIRENPALAHTIVVTWTSSIAPHEADTLIRLGVTRHVIKPMRLEEYVQIGTLLRDLLDARDTASTDSGR
jgi:two-component system, response regulator